MPRDEIAMLLGKLLQEAEQALLEDPNEKIRQRLELIIALAQELEAQDAAEH